MATRGLFPGDYAFGSGVGAHIVGIGAAEGDEFLFGCAAAGSALTVKQQHLVLVLDAAGEVGLNLAQGEIDGGGQMSADVLTGGAHVDDHGATLEVALRILDGDKAAATVN